jgi:hypothetical protein
VSRIIEAAFVNVDHSRCGMQPFAGKLFRLDFHFDGFYYMSLGGIKLLWNPPSCPEAASEFCGGSVY